LPESISKINPVAFLIFRILQESTDFILTLILKKTGMPKIYYNEFGTLASFPTAYLLTTRQIGLIINPGQILAGYACSVAIGMTALIITNLDKMRDETLASSS
jgi:hypothetical protein